VLKSNRNEVPDIDVMIWSGCGIQVKTCEDSQYLMLENKIVMLYMDSVQERISMIQKQALSGVLFDVFDGL